VAAYHIDPILGSDSNAGTSKNAPWKTYDKTWSGSNIWIPGNTIKLRRGRQYDEYWTARGSGTLAQPITITHYGDDDQAPILQTPTGGSQQGFSCLTHTGLTIDGLEIHGDTQYGIDYSLNTSTTDGPLIVRNCNIRAKYNGIFAARGAGSTPGAFPGCILEDNDIHDCGEHGIQIGPGMAGWRVSRNRIRRVGLSVGSHGISVWQSVYQGTLTWSLLSGNVYQATITGATHTPSFSTTPWIDSVVVVVGGATWNRWTLLDDRVTAPASLAAGRYQYSGGVLYVNCGGFNPTSAIFFEMFYGGCRNWTVNDNDVDEVARFNGTEGACIQADFNTTYGDIVGNLVKSQTGAGPINCNGGPTNRVRSNIVESSSGSGIVCTRTHTSEITDNTVICGAADGGSAIQMDGGLAGGLHKFNNNIVTGTTTYAITDYDTTGGTYEVKNNSISGYVSPTNETGGGRLTFAGSFTGTVVGDPQLRGDRMPMASAVRSAGIASGQRDFYGKERRGTIGAVQYRSARAAVVRNAHARNGEPRAAASRRAATA
jgi:hypothetical protein